MVSIISTVYKQACQQSLWGPGQNAPVAPPPPPPPVGCPVYKYMDKYTVEPLIVDSPNKGHDRNNLSIKDTSLGPKCSLSHSTNTSSTSKERTTSLQRIKWLVPTCPLFRGSTVILTCYFYSSTHARPLHSNGSSLVKPLFAIIAMISSMLLVIVEQAVTTFRHLICHFE